MTTKTAALRYARALFDVALHEKADFDRIDRELSDFVALMDREVTLKKVFLNPAVPVPRKRAAMEQLTARGGLSPTVAKLLALLAERDRLILLPDLVAALRARVNAYRHVVQAEVTTAEPMPTDKLDAIRRRLADVTGQQVMLDSRVDPRILGGLVAKVGSTVYDASMTRQLQKLREQLIENA